MQSHAGAKVHRLATVSRSHEIILENVKEHAPPLAGASVETGVDVHTTGDVADRVASGGCCVSSCSALRIHLTLTSILGLDGPSLISKKIVAGT
jgi:hypothetical protein